MRSGGDLGQYGEIHPVAMHGSQGGAGAGAAATSALESRLPKTSQYRVRASLSIVQEAIRMSDIALDGIKIITIGATLLREGVTVKTNNHRLATTAMIICASLDSLKKVGSWKVDTGHGAHGRLDAQRSTHARTLRTERSHRASSRGLQVSRISLRCRRSRECH